MPNGATYKEEMPLISSAEALQISLEESESLEDEFAASTDPVQNEGSKMALDAKVQLTEDEHNLYLKKIVSMIRILLLLIAICCVHGP